MTTAPWPHATTSNGVVIVPGLRVRDYNWRETTVVGVSHTEDEQDRGVPTGRQVTWFDTANGGMFDGSRLFALDAGGCVMNRVVWSSATADAQRQHAATVEAMMRAADTAYIAEQDARYEREFRTVVGKCTGCGSVEVRLDAVSGTRDLSGIGESATYPTGYGCELCS